MKRSQVIKSLEGFLDITLPTSLYNDHPVDNGQLAEDIMSFLEANDYIQPPFTHRIVAGTMYEDAVWDKED